MPSRIDEAGHTKAFDDPVAEHWGENRRTGIMSMGGEGVPQPPIVVLGKSVML